jgi:hypothetical protein
MIKNEVNETFLQNVLNNSSVTLKILKIEKEIYPRVFLSGDEILIEKVTPGKKVLFQISKIFSFGNRYIHTYNESEILGFLNNLSFTVI